MLHKKEHLTYNVRVSEFLKNFDYLVKYSQQADVSITVRRANTIIATLLAPSVAKEISDFIEKMETRHQTDMMENKRLKKEVEMLRLRLDIKDNLGTHE